jgi:hypothetical protein
MAPIDARLGDQRPPSDSGNSNEKTRDRFPGAGFRKILARMMICR